MCQSCEKLGQRTFGEIVALEPVVPVQKNLAGYVTCEDSGSIVDPDNATEDKHGNFWEDSNNLAECEHCNELTPKTELGDNDDYCEECRQEHYDSCSDCGGVISREDATSNEDGDTFCDRCYSRTYTTCAGCESELRYNDCVDRHGCNYCESCAPSDDSGEIEEDSHWRGRDVFDKIGSRRKFGVELETDSCDGWSEWVGDTGWGGKEDGTVSGKEFVSPILYGDDGYDSAWNFAKRMTREGYDVDSSCGYHLHCDLSDTSEDERKSIALAYAYTCDFWLSCVDEERRTNTYCHPNVHDGRVHWDVATIKDGDGHPECRTRYVWLNWCAYSSHKTVEVRLHHGTCDAREVCNWIKAHLRFIDFVVNMTPGQITRMFGNKTMASQVRNMRDIWRDDELSDYYARAVGVEENAYA